MSTIVFGTCERCGSPLEYPRYATGEPMPECECTRDLDEMDVTQAVDRGREFDHTMHALHLLFMVEEERTPLNDLMLGLSADVGNAQAALLNKDYTAARAFLVRVAAMIRYLSVDRKELSDEP